MQNRFEEPYPMCRISFPTSNSELETWVEQTIQREIARGKLLQDQKSLSSERKSNVDVFIKMPKLAHGGNCDRSIISKWNKRGHPRNKSPLAKNARMSSLVSRDDSCSSYKSPRLGRPACSLRISELAAPTKRQCISAWRANANVLPETMINRLKQRVLDQEPIVKVSDAVNCLRRNRRVPRNNVIVTPSKRHSRAINKEAMKNRIQAEYKVLSEAFGMKIAEKLMKPMVITLNSQLKNISHIISEEICNIIKETKTFKTDKGINKRMVQETSEKVTIWIAKILEDTSENLLEEELRDLEEKEGPVLDLIDDFVDSVLHLCIKTPSDLTPEYLSVTSDDGERQYQQETEIDEKTNKDTIENDIMKQLNYVIDSVTGNDSINSPSNVSYDLSKNDEEIYGEHKTKPDEDIKSEAYINPESDIKQEQDIKLESDFDVLYTNDNPLAMTEDDNDEHTENTSGNISEPPELRSTENDIDEPPTIQTNENIDGEQLDDNLLLAPEENNVTDKNNEQASNVSGAIEIVTEELSEGKNKTVQFSNFDLMNDLDKGQYTPFNRDNAQLEDEQLSENIAYIERPQIDFAPPNEELLSDADESWPDTIHITKPSASVTRSITSMGRILETDEIFSTAFEDSTEYSLISNTTDSIKHLDDDIYENNQQNTLEPELSHDLKENDKNYLGESGDLQKNKDFAQFGLSNLPHGPVIESEIDKPSGMFLIDSIILAEDEVMQNSQTYEDNTVWESVISKFKRPQSPEEGATTYYVEEPQSAEELISQKLNAAEFISEKLITHELNAEELVNKLNAEELISQKLTAEELISHKFDYRVHLKTAPAWIRRGQGEPNGGPCACRPIHNTGTEKKNEREREILKWCQDLDFILMNLDKWKNWLDYISKYITDLKRKAGKANRGGTRSPPRGEIDKTWRQLHKRATAFEIRRKDETVKLKIPSAPLKYCRNCGRRKPNQTKKRHYQSNLRNTAELKCKRHYRTHEAYLRKH